MPTEKTQAAADAALDALVTALAARQAGVRGALGRYRQVRRDGDWGTWAAQRPAVDDLTCWVDEYLSPAGAGYVVRAEIVEDGVRYHRAANVGPETWRSHDWQSLDQEKEER